MSRYDGADSYTYPGSDVLKNRIGLRDQAALDAFEADATAIRLLELTECPIPGCKIPGEHFLADLPPDQFISRLAHYMGEINAAHPFREGNGRVQRAFCAQLAERAGYYIDFSQVGRDEMYAAMIASFRGDNVPLTTLLARVCTQLE